MFWNNSNNSHFILGVHGLHKHSAVAIVILVNTQISQPLLSIVLHLPYNNNKKLLYSISNINYNCVQLQITTDSAGSSKCLPKKTIAKARVRFSQARWPFWCLSNRNRNSNRWIVIWFKSWLKRKFIWLPDDFLMWATEHGNLTEIWLESLNNII